MDQESSIYLTNISIGVILAVLLSHYWFTQGKTAAMRLWIIAAWVMTVTDVLFAIRSTLPSIIGRTLPTLGVTLGLVVLCLGACTIAGRSRPWRILLAVLAVHGALLAFMVGREALAPWRILLNGSTWVGLSMAAAYSLRGATRHYWQTLFAPANVFLAHAAFHFVRMTLAVLADRLGWTAVSNSMHGLIGDLEVSFFMIALFVSLLIATLQQRHEELSSARAEVETLSGLLPICAWCKKVRDDDGYWRQVEEYFERRGQVRFTHGICSECASDQLKEHFAEHPPKDKA